MKRYQWVAFFLAAAMAASEIVPAAALTAAAAETSAEMRTGAAGEVQEEGLQAGETVQTGQTDGAEQAEEAGETAQAAEEAEDKAQAGEGADDTAQATEEAGETAQAAEETGDIAQAGEEADDTAQAAEEADDMAQATEETDDIAQEGEEADDTAQDAEEAGETAQAAEETDDIAPVEDALQEKKAEKADAAETDNHFNAYIEGFDLDIYTYTAWMELKPGQEQVLRVKAVADDCSRLTYTWICDGEVVREVTAAELKAQGLPETSDELRIVGEKECRYQVRVSDGYSEDPIIRNLDVEIDNDFTAYPAGAHIRASGTAEESRTIYAAYGETLTLKTCASAYDAEHITYEWYGQNGYSPMGEYGDSIQVTVTRACTYRCRVKDGYDHNKDAYFYIKLAEGFKAWPEGAGIDEYGQRAKEITISTTPGERLTLRVITEGAKEAELIYTWGRQSMAAGGDQEEDRPEEIDAFDTTEHEGASAEVSPFVTTYYYCSVEDDYGTLVDLTFRVIVNGFTAYPEGAVPDKWDSSGKAQYVLHKVYPGEEVTLRTVVDKAGDPQLSYEWSCEDWATGQRTELSCTEPSMTITAESEDSQDIDGNPVQAVKNMNYYCTVSDDFGNSRELRFGIMPKAVAAHPQNPVIYSDGRKLTDKTIEADAGEKLVLRTEVDTDDGAAVTYTYSWKKNNGPFEEGGSSLAVTADETASYTCRVKDPYGSYTDVRFTVEVRQHQIDVKADAPEYTADEATYRIAPGESCELKLAVGPGTKLTTIIWSAGTTTIATDVESVLVSPAVSTSYRCLVKDQYEAAEFVHMRVVIDNKLTAVPAGITETNYIEEENRVQLYAQPSESVTLKAETSTATGSELHYRWQARPIDEKEYYKDGWQSFDTDAEELTVSTDRDMRYECVVTDEYRSRKEVLFDLIVSDLKDLSRAVVKLTPEKMTFTGGAVTPQVTVTYRGQKLTEGTDYTVSYYNNTPEFYWGTGSVLVLGTGAFTGFARKEFKIEAADQTLTAGDLTLPVGGTGKIAVSGAKGYLYYDVVSGRDVATVDEKGNLKALKEGTATVLVCASAMTGYNSAGTSIQVEVTPAAELPVAPAKLTAVNLANGVEITWSAVSGATGYVIYRSGAKIAEVSGAQTVAYRDSAANTNGTTYRYQVYAVNDAGMSKTAKAYTIFRIARPAIASVTGSAAGKATVTWGKIDKVTGYKVQYSSKSDFSSFKTVTVSKASTVSQVIGSLGKGKTYYFRVRGYKTSGTGTFYSQWSMIKKVKIVK